MTVRNMTGNSGREIPNQFVIIDDEGNIWFQSYRTMIAKKQAGKIILDAAAWDASQTTGKYRDMFLGENKKETERKIKSGEYRLENLN